MEMKNKNDIIEIRPQPKQAEFLRSSADIVIGGGAAGGGKTYALLLEPLRHINKKGFNAVFLRRTYPEITKPGGIWEEATKLYPHLGGQPNMSLMRWSFGKASISFGSITNEQTLENWKSTQAELLLFDQLETFSEKMFFYMGSRNRGTSGVKSYQRATANPMPGWLANFIDWWIADDGYADMNRVGVMRAFVRIDEQTYWADTKEELVKKFGKDVEPKTVTYIPFTIYDNPILLKKDPGYVASLKAMSYVDRARLLGDPVRGGNWRVKPAAGKVFNRDWFEIVDIHPTYGTRVRYFDMAGGLSFSEKGDYTCGIEMLYDGNYYYITDMFLRRLRASELDSVVDKVIIDDASNQNFAGLYSARWEIEPGSASRRDSVARTKRLAGIDAKGISKTVSKLIAWKPLAAAAESRLVKVVSGNWNEQFLHYMHGVPELDHDDVPDAASGAFAELTKENRATQKAQQRRY